jgi:hypothetical protein
MDNGLLAVFLFRRKTLATELSKEAEDMARMMNRLAEDRHVMKYSRWGLRRHLWPILSAFLLCQAHGLAQSGPEPPCGQTPAPPYPRLDESATVQSWNASDIGRDWKPPACTGWTAVGFTTLVATVARFRLASDADGLLRHIGAISALTGMRYWSATRQQWQTLIVDAYALTGMPSGHRRNDFTLEEMREGRVLYFEQVDNLTGKALYRLHIATASADRFVVDVENVSTMHYLFIPVAHPGDLQSIYFLDRESDHVWRYYSIMRIGLNANRLASGKPSSAINRAVAFFRYIVGIPTTQEPPAAVR